MSSKRFLIPIFIAAALIAGFFSGVYFEKSQTTSVVTLLKGVANKELGQPQGVDFSLFWTVWNTVRDKFVDKEKLDDQNMIYGAIEGMVKTSPDIVFRQD